MQQLTYKQEVQQPQQQEAIDPQQGLEEQQEEEQENQQQENFEEGKDVKEDQQQDGSRKKLTHEQTTRSVILSDFQEAVDQNVVKQFVEAFGETECIREDTIKGSNNKQYIITFKSIDSVTKIFDKCGYHCNIENQDAKIKLIRNLALKINLRYIDTNLDNETIANVLREFIKEQNPNEQVPPFTCQFIYTHDKKQGANLQLVKEEDRELILKSVNNIEFDKKLMEKAYPGKQLKLIDNNTIDTRIQLKQNLQNEGEFLQIHGEIEQRKPLQQRGFYHNNSHYGNKFHQRHDRHGGYQQRYQPRNTEQTENKYPEENSVYVTNMPKSTPKQDLLDMFGEVKPEQVFFKKQKDRNKEFCSAVCYFDTPEKAKQAIEKQGYKIKDRDVYVKENKRNELREQQRGYSKQ